MAAPRPLTTGDYETLASFRYTLARFLGFSEAAAASAGLTPRQYQALLALKGHRGPGPLTVGGLAERLQVHHHSAVGLVDRLESLGLVRRATARGDQRRVHVVPTAKGTRRVARLAALHRDELRLVAARLRDVLDRLAGPSRGSAPQGPADPAASGTSRRRAR